MVCPYCIGHSGSTSAHFGLTACSTLWLLASVQVDCVSLTAVLILDMSMLNQDSNFTSPVCQAL